MALTDNIVAYWKLDTDNATQSDSVGSNDGTVSGATYTASGKISGGYSFDGVNDSIDLGNSLIGSAVTFTYSAWVKLTTNTSYGEVVAYGNTGNSNPMFRVGVNSSGKPYYFIKDDTGGYFREMSGSTVLSTGTWYHIIWVSRDYGDIDIYVDNVAETISTDATSGTTAGAISLNTAHIGKLERSSSADFFDGVIDEVGIWNAVISSDDRGELYNSGDGFQYDFTNPSLTITTPNGGEEYNPLSEQTIVWDLVVGSAPKTVDNVQIEISTNNGASYSDIVASTANNGSYDWTTPDVQSEECLVRISDVNDSTVNDVSNAVFTVKTVVILSATGSKGTRAIATRYPVDSGLTAFVNKQSGRQTQLIAQNSRVKSSNNSLRGIR